MGIDDDDEAREKILGELPPLLAAVRRRHRGHAAGSKRARPATETGKQLLAFTWTRSSASA